MLRSSPAIVAIAFVLASGYVNGLWNGRWSTSDGLASHASRLALVPREVGDWEGRDRELDPRVLEHAGIVAGLLREYVNRRTGDVLTALLVGGRPGPISVHTPEVCYAGAGFDETRPRARVAIAAGPTPGADTFWAAEFDKRDSALPERIRILYAWKGEAEAYWMATESARVEFAGSPFLYKMYVVRSLPAGAAKGPDPGEEFLAALLPEIRGTLQPGHPPAPPGEPGRTALADRPRR